MLGFEIVTKSCTIGSLPRNIVKCRKKKFIGKFPQIIEWYKYSESEVKYQKSHWKKGVASFCLLDDIPQQELSLKGKILMLYKSSSNPNAHNLHYKNCGVALVCLF